MTFRRLLVAVACGLFATALLASAGEPDGPDLWSGEPAAAPILVTPAAVPGPASRPEATPHVRVHVLHCVWLE